MAKSGPAVRSCTEFIIGRRFAPTHWLHAADRRDGDARKPSGAASAHFAGGAVLRTWVI
jgi:hypothetical protein